MIGLLRRCLPAALCAALLASGSSWAASPPRSGDGAKEAADPYRWLEQVQDAKALAWVRARNAESTRLLQAQPEFRPMRDRLRAILDAKDRIPEVDRIGDRLYNLWQDERHPRGLWRRTTLEEYRKAEPAWETVLDLDALSATEKESWVWVGAQCLGPREGRCLVALSRGGADARVVREFDLATRRFVAGGFALPEAKSNVAWVDADTIFVGTDFGPGSLTDSGYVRVLKRWKRGTPLAAAPIVFEGERGDVEVDATVHREPGFERTLFVRALDFYRRKTYLLRGDAAVPLDVPDDAEVSFDRDQIVIELRSAWKPAGEEYPAGALLAGDAEAFLSGGRALRVLFAPSPGRALGRWIATRSHYVLQLRDQVAGRIEEWPRSGGARRSVAAPYPGQLEIAALHDPEQGADDPLGDRYLVSYTDFLTPTTLSLGRAGSDEREPLKANPPRFDAEGMRVEQRFATSQDGTRVPYFIVWPRGARADGSHKTLLYGYGGFEVSMDPSYSASIGSAWLERGGVFVLANIRGGGEFGPAWHQAAVKGGRQRSFDDFIAVAEDLIATKVTSPAHLGIEGGSHGGLLVGAVMLQRPELFNAVICQVPLLDMRRYHKLLAGASWMAEYGDPDDPADWAVISRYSPYQNVRAGIRYPRVFFVTSTRDDRVHPGHARKMAAKMRAQHHPVLYYESLEGGHRASADNRQRAERIAMEFAFLHLQLGGGKEPRR